MNFWCKILGHTWTPDTASTDVHWHTTKKGDVLEPRGPEDGVRYFDRCIRCGDRREVPAPAAELRDAAVREARAQAAPEAKGADETEEDSAA